MGLTEEQQFEIYEEILRILQQHELEIRALKERVYDE